MKKAGARTGQLVRSASRRGKAASRFQFDVTVERLFGGIVRPGNTYYVKWSRGVKVAQTKPALAAKDHVGGNKAAGGLPFNDKISLLVTLYRTDNRFDEKDAKFAVISVNAKGQERTVAKMHFDLSQFAGVPSASAEKIFKMSEKASIKTTVDARFMKSGTKGPGSAGASSAMSGMTAASGLSSDDADDDFGDLDVDDVPEPEAPVVGGGRGKRTSNASSGKAITASPQKRRSNPPFSPPSSKEDIPGPIPNSSTKSFGRQPSGSGAGSGGDTKLRAELTSAKEELSNVSMDLRRAQDKRKRMEAAHEAELASLRAKLAAAPAAGGRGGDPAVERELAKERRRADELGGKLEAVNRDLAAIRGERDTLKGEMAPLRASAKEVEKLREANGEMSREIDHLAASAGGGNGDQVVRERMGKLQEEKAKLEEKVRAHQKHSATVKDTYQRLTGMYNTLREENIELQGKLEDVEKQVKEAESGRKDAERKALEASSAASDAASRAAAAARRESFGAGGNRGSPEEQLEAAESQLAVSEREVGDIKASKQALQRDYDHMKAQNDALQGRVDKAMSEKEKTRKEGDALAAKLAEVTVQRDAAVSRADRAGSRESTSAADAAKMSAAIKAREEGEREIVRLKQQVSEIEREMADKAEDLEYERSEKTKAREERDALRESARALERRTSQVSQTADAVHSLKRQLSTHKMRDADHTAMIKDLRNEVKRLQAEVDVAGSRGGGGGGGNDDDGAVLEDLVMTKLALATAEDEKLRLQFELKNQKKSERAVQEKLAAHASRLEVQLGEANDELAKARALRNSDDDGSLL